MNEGVEAGGDIRLDKYLESPRKLHSHRPE